MNIQVNLGRERAGSLWSVKGGGSFASSAGIVEHIQSMAEMVGAEDYLVFRVGSLGARSTAQLSTVLSSPTLDDDRHAAVATRFGPLLLSHIEGALVPLVHLKARPTDGLQHLAANVPAAAASAFAGRDCIAFPVKLGALGNGVLVLIGRRLDITAEQVLELHRKCFKVLKALLRLELKKAAPRQNLNDRELECLQLAGEGLKSELIAERLSLSVHTVNAYLGSATAKLDSVNRIQAIAKAIRLGYLA